MQKKLAVLARIARRFNEAGLRWAVGASLMLYLRGVAEDFHDIDLMVAEEDAFRAEAILASMGEILPAKTGGNFRTKLFRECIIGGVEVDLMAGFCIVCDGIEHSMPFSADAGIETVQTGGETVPLQGLAFWRECYCLMGRWGKVRQIDQWQRNRCEPLRSWIVELQAIAQCGLAYVKDPYDRERYERLRELSGEMMARLSGLPVGRMPALFLNETGYQTPKIDTRAAVFRDGRILLVRERDGRWSLPGGWCDVLESVASNTIKEVREEAGLAVVPERLIAVQDRNRHNPPAYAYGICKVFLLCRETGGAFRENSETTAAAYFECQNLPPLAEEKCTAAQVEMCFRAAADPGWKVQFD